MTVGELKKTLRCLDREMEVICETNEEFYLINNVYADQQGNLVCNLELL